MSHWKHQADLEALARHEAPDDAALDALHLRLQTPRPRRRRGWVVAAAVAAGLLVGLLVRGLPVDLDRRLVSEAEVQHEPLGREVAVTYQGRGEARGTARDLRIHWETGRLHTEVEPDRDVVVQVSTPEATVTVVGTAFTVDRDGLGTTVAVERGAVDLACRGEAALRLTASDSHRCFRSAAAVLRQLTDVADPAEALALVERGLRLEGEGAAADELRARRVGMLLALGRPAEARAAAEALLARGAGPREAELRSQVARLAWESGGCAEALPLLRALQPLDGLSATPLVLLGDCVVDQDPDEARAAWERALGLVTSPEEGARVRTRLERLP